MTKTFDPETPCVERMMPEEKKKFLEGRANMISLVGSLGNTFKNAQGMTSTITSAGEPKSASHLMEGSKAMAGSKHGK